MLYQADYRLLSSLPESVWGGEILLLTIELTNRGTIPWLTFGRYPVHLSYHWQTLAGQPVVPDGFRNVLPMPVPPGHHVVMEMRVEPPPTPGTYQLVVDLVEEGIGWFSERGVAPLVLPVTYLPCALRHATILNGNVVANDAVGNHVATQLRLLREAGYHTLLITEFVDPRLPVDIRRSSVAIKYRDIEHPSSQLQWVLNHFHMSDLLVVNYSTYYELAQMMTLARRSAILFDYHGITPPHLWGDETSPGYQDLQRGQQHLALVQYADYAVGHSRYTTNELLRTGLIPEDRVATLPYGVLQEVRACPPPDPLLVRRYRPNGEAVLLYVGRMARNKRIIDLVEAMPIILQHHPGTILLLVGDNHTPPYRDYAAEVMERAKELGCQHQVIFTGQVADLTPYYALCDLFVTASVHEGFGMPVIEAMARGKPVVAANATALPETVNGGGVLFEPGNPVHLAEHVTALLDEQRGRKPFSSPSPLFLRKGTTEHLASRTISMVTPRYGVDVLGGAESGIRGWAEQLAKRGYRVEVLTTCTDNMIHWNNRYPPGRDEVNGIPVHRFPIDDVDVGAFHQVHAKLIHGEYVSYQDELVFARNSLQSSALNAYLRDHAEEMLCAIFTPYLFGTTYWGAQVVPDKAIVLPCLHDEPLARLTIFREMLEGAAGIFFNTEAEERFATDTLGVVNPHRAIIGYGFSDAEPVGDANAFRAKYALPDQPMVLYSGRLEQYKNVPLLIEYFVRYKREHPDPLILVLAGDGDVSPPNRPDIVATGTITDRQELANAYAAATVLCQLSLRESFSLVIMESWMQGRPVLVHGDCAVTRQHVEQCGGGYAPRGYEEFRTALHRLVSDPAHADELGRRGRAYVLSRYHWDAIIDRIVRGIQTCIIEQTTYDRLARHGIRHALAFTTTRFRDAFLPMVERTHLATGTQIPPHLVQQLYQIAQVGMPDYTVQSTLPLVGKFIAWTRRQLTSHLKEPYLDPIIARQEQFNRELLRITLNLLEQSGYEQRRLKRELEILRSTIQHGSGKGSCT